MEIFTDSRVPLFFFCFFYTYLGIFEQNFQFFGTFFPFLPINSFDTINLAIYTISSVHIKLS